MILNGKEIRFVNGVADKVSSMRLWSIGFIHTGATYYWLETDPVVPIISSKNIENWILMHKDSLPFSSDDPLHFERTYAAPTEEEILIWKLKRTP